MSKDFKPLDESPIKGVHYRWTVLAALADYLDAGAIVAGAASLTYWISYFHLSSILTGLLAALSPNAIGAAIGASIAGPLGDRYGRKAIYMYDMIVYFIGAIIVAASINLFMLLLGYLIVALTVGIDVPTSWSLIAEFSPRKNRGRLMSFTNLFWMIGPIVVLIIGIVTSPLGVNSFRIIFASLALVAIITWALRRGIPESPRWASLKGKEKEVKRALQELGLSSASPLEQSQTTPTTSSTKIRLSKFRKGILFSASINTIWSLPAGTFGFFAPYIFKDIGKVSVIVADFLQMLGFITTIIGLLLSALAVPLVDRISRRFLYATSAIVSAIAWIILIIFPLTILAVPLVSSILLGLSGGMGTFPVKRIWQAELFPTEIRSTAQAIAWSSERYFLGIWSIFVPIIVNSIGLSAIGAVSAACFITVAIIGGIFGPESQGKSLEQVLREFYGEDILK